MKAIFKTVGKQYYVQENDRVYIEKLDAEAGAKVTFDEVLGMFMGNKSKNVNVYKKSEDKMNNFFNNK